MKVNQIFDLVLRAAIKNDLRGEKKVLANLKRVNEKYAKLPKDKKENFDEDRLTNPYADSRVLFDSGKDVKRVMAGIDIDTSELLVAKALGKIDLVIAHHPIGRCYADLGEVVPMQAEVYATYGIPINVAQGCVRLRAEEVSRGVRPINHFKTVDAARNLNISLLSAHTVCDNLVANFLKKEVAKKKFEYVGEIMDFLKAIPEYKEATKMGFGPSLFTGSEENYCGKIALTEIAGGASGSPLIYERLAHAGIGTIIGMHMNEEHRKEAEKNHINVIIAGHISSDSIGVNLFLDELEKKGIEVVPCSGLIRVKRVKK